MSVIITVSVLRTDVISSQNRPMYYIVLFYIADLYIMYVCPKRIASLYHFKRMPVRSARTCFSYMRTAQSVVAWWRYLYPVPLADMQTPPLKNGVVVVFIPRPCPIADMQWTVVRFCTQNSQYLGRFANLIQKL